MVGYVGFRGVKDSVNHGSRMRPGVKSKKTEEIFFVRRLANSNLPIEISGRK